MQHRPMAIAISFALAASPAIAQTTDVQPASSTDVASKPDSNLERMVVVSSRVAMPIREIATSVSVLTRDDIETRGYANLADVLRTQPSITVTSNGSAGSTTSLRIRGEEGYRTQVRIDGVEVSDPTGTQVGPNFGQIQSSNINRVEILRGSQGLVYGADAGGVINIETANGVGEPSGQVSAEYGRYNATNLAADVGGSSDKFDYYVAASDFSTDGFNSRVNTLENQDDDGYDNTTLHTRLGYQVNEQVKLNFVARNTNAEGEYDSCFGASGSTNDCENKFDQTDLRVSANYSTNTSEHQFSLAKSFIEREFITEGLSSFDTKGTVERAEYLGTTELNQNANLVYGIDWKQEKITSDDDSRTQRGYYLEYQSEVISNLFVTAGVRHDDNEDFGEHTSYRLSSAYIWAVGDNELKLRGAYGTGFRAPSLSEIAYNTGPFSNAPASETALKEETTKGFEVGLTYTLASGSQFEATYFDQKIQDSIYFDLAAFSGYLQDLGESSSKGIELIADLVISDTVGVTANYTYNDTEDTAGDQRRRRPRNAGSVSLYYDNDAWKLAATLRSLHDAVDGIQLKGYEVFDVSARYAVNQDLSLSARIENAFDANYQDIAAYNTSGAAAYVGVQYQF
ncbi:TonB-dependent receptor plug domain-containing protein [Paraglaciecola polaris]|uniref:Iron complex outermembrane recepter protein n=1 Tax=Paraglaciecola polaris LMG 21857 TaxID=1129793 RepID=K7A795_9ALTE|nr:TonB-dependent receptor [Paraglaciecola polaris]GAC31285.1 iron complex outermembrane recepter protein [Paraglaciecola polaris LMG 21857]